MKKKKKLDEVMRVIERVAAGELVMTEDQLYGHVAAYACANHTTIGKIFEGAVSRAYATVKAQQRADARRLSTLD